VLVEMLVLVDVPVFHNELLIARRARVSDAEWVQRNVLKCVVHSGVSRAEKGDVIVDCRGENLVGLPDCEGEGFRPVLGNLTDGLKLRRKQ
jgi:hypothetical protein